jgi:hypothetical protein
MATSHLCPGCGRWHLANLRCERTVLARYQSSDAGRQDDADVAETLSIARYLTRTR